MNTHGRGPVDRRTAERLLVSAAEGQPVGPDPLVRLIRAATLPGGPAELAGEDRAVAAFRGARLAPETVRGRRSLRASLARMVTVRAAALAGALSAGALTVGGVALAASTGALPALPLIGPATHAPAVHDGKPGPGQNGTPAHGSPSPALIGLCHAWLAGATENPGKAADAPAFEQLVAAAGGADRVRGYCEDLLPTATPDSDKDATDKGRPSGTPDAHPTATPSEEATRHPGKDPSRHPDREPAASPTSP